jgi:ATP-binding cassette subfamily B protein
MMLDFLSDDEYSFLAPEVIQTSAMDCGPAALKCFLEGFGISVSYGRLREACQTDVDGTSINTLEDVAIQLGLDAEQIIVPLDHLLLPNSHALPALIVVLQPNQLTHLVVAWRVQGPFVQLMDPGTGRRWQTHQRFLNQLYIHQYPVPASDWREWAGSDEFCGLLRQRMQNLDLNQEEIESLFEVALAESNWHPLAKLDAATRMVATIVRAGGLHVGREAGEVLLRFFKDTTGTMMIPDSYWSVLPAPPERNLPEDYLLLQGALLIRVTGRRLPAPSQDWGGEREQAPLSPELMAALKETPFNPFQELFSLLRQDGMLAPALLSLALFMATLAIMIEALLFRGLLELGASLELVPERIQAVTLLFIFLGSLFLLEIPMATMMIRFGRKLETRLRVKFLSKIPRLSDRYFHSRLTSDMAQRAYELRQLRVLPQIAVQWVRLAFQIVLTTLGVIWLNPNPSSVLLALLATLFAIAFSIATQPFLVEQDLVLRTHTGALSRFYLDALLGLIPIRTHSAEKAVRQQHESLLVEWLHASQRFYDADTMIRVAQRFLGSFFAFWILYDYLMAGGEVSGVLLLFYWTLRLPALGQALAEVTQQYPMYRNRVLRLLEPLGAPEEWEGEEPLRGDGEGAKATPLVAEGVGATKGASKPSAVIEMVNLSIQAGGHTILENINLTIEAGTHIAIVGPSGAGKSSLVGLLLGWHRPAAGELRIDGQPLKGQKLLELRRETAWVDPAVQLWNRSLLNNLTYGTQTDNVERMTHVIEQAELFEVLEELPHGLQSQLGEGGGLLSGGQGQRVRLARAMYRQGVRLVILDEPFRGLDRSKRRELLARARDYWQEATLIFISHDVGQTENFERVLVIEKGHIVEDDKPKALLAQETSRYRALLEAEKAVRQGMWERKEWRRLWMENGRLNDDN